VTVIHLSTPCRVLSLLLMSCSIVAHTRLAGSAQGTFLDDLTNRMSSPTSTSSRFYNTYPRILAGVGQWPKTQAIKKISKIAVYAGDIVDSVRITYQVENAPTPITVQHGGPGGAQAISFEIGGNMLFSGVQIFVHPRTRNSFNYS
jgi:hypothetical protein